MADSPTKKDETKPEVLGHTDKVELSPDEFFDGIAQVEKARQESNFRQIEANDKDNERQFQYATGEAIRANTRWYVAFGVSSLIVFIILALGVYLVAIGKDELGFKVITHLATAVLGFIAGFGVSKVGKQ